MTSTKVCTAIFFSVISIFAWADEAPLRKADAAVLISQTASEICAEAQTGGSSQQGEVKANVSAKLGALVRKLGDVNGSLSASYAGETHNGVLKEQVLDAAKEANSCKKHVFDELLERLLPKGDTKIPSSIKASQAHDLTPHEVYLIATHPTNVSVEDVTFSNFINDGDVTYLSVKLKNNSDIPAEFTSIEIVREKKGVPLTKSEVIPVKKSSFYSTIGANEITIPASSSSDFPIISTSELSHLAGAKNEIYCLYDASPNSINFNEQTEAFTNALSKAPVSEMEHFPQTRQISIRIRIKYTTIFKQSITSYALIYAHYTERDDKGLIFYPSTKKAARPNCIQS